MISKMASSISLTLSVAVLFPLALAGDIQISFNTSANYYSGYSYTNYVGYYYASEKDTAALTCYIPRRRGPIGIVAWTWYGRRDHILVENGFISMDETLSGRYSFERSLQTNTLIIRNLKLSDSSYYSCWYNYKDWCYDRWYGTYRCDMREVATVYLNVLETTSAPMESDFCDLVGSFHGVFFTGEDLILMCPTKELNITASNLFYESTLNYKFQHDTRTDNNFYLLTIENLTEELNGTTLTCFEKDRGDGTDYCRLFPNISVFNELTVTTSPQKVIVENGGNVTIYCHSSPYLKAVEMSFQWNFFDNKVTFGDMTESETSTGVQILIEKIDFQNSTESSFIVVCRVRTGSRNSSSNVTVTLLQSRTPSSSVTTLVPLVAVVLIGLLIILVSGIVYKKVPSPTNNKGKISNEKEGTLKENETVKDGNLYDKCNITKETLGLTENDSKVVYNVAYVSYDADDDE